MGIKGGLTKGIKQVGADAILPAGSSIKIALIDVSAKGTYDQDYDSVYVEGLDGDEVPTGNGYTQGGLALKERTSGPTDSGWVGYSNPVWKVTGELASIGAVVYDSTKGDRVVGFIDFGATKKAFNATFMVQLPAGLVRIN
jgi:hypothetical protein